MTTLLLLMASELISSRELEIEQQSREFCGAGWQDREKHTETMDILQIARYQSTDSYYVAKCGVLPLSLNSIRHAKVGGSLTDHKCVWRRFARIGKVKVLSC